MVKRIIEDNLKIAKHDIGFELKKEETQKMTVDAVSTPPRSLPVPPALAFCRTMTALLSPYCRGPHPNHQHSRPLRPHRMGFLYIRCLIYADMQFLLHVVGHRAPWGTMAHGAP